MKYQSINPDQRATTHHTTYLHMPKKLSEQSMHVSLNCALHVFLCSRQQGERLTIALRTDLDRTLLAPCLWISGKAHGNILHHPFIKKIKQHSTDQIFYHQFGILY